MRLDADERVNRFILARFRGDTSGRFLEMDPVKAHLRECSEASATNSEAYDSTYGCDTGCDYMRFEATIACPHGQRYDYEWGDFGELAYYLDELLAED
jgi:hypothetical protein